jgi:hypothetical protein
MSHGPRFTPMSKTLDNMPQKITTTALRKWKRDRFLHEMAYLPDNSPPVTRKFKDMIFDRTENAAQYKYASKAIKIGHTADKHEAVWVVLHSQHECISFYTANRQGYADRYYKDVDQLNRTALFQCPDKELRALLFFFFVDCGGAGELPVYDGFYDQLEKAFRRHIDLKKKKKENELVHTQANTPAATTSAKRPRDESGGADAHSRKYHSPSTRMYQPVDKRRTHQAHPDRKLRDNFSCCEYEHSF